MSDAPSPGQPTELQQLEAALAAGAITPELFATLKEKLQPVAPAPPPAPARVPAPSTEELPSLLDMFSRPPSPAAAPEVRPAAAPPVVAGPTAQELAARQRIDEHLARLRQVPAAVASSPRPEPPAPVFYPEPLPEPPTQAPAPAPTFYPEAPAPVQAAPPAAPPRARPAAAPTSASASRSWLVVLLLLAVVGGLAYYFTSSSHPDEELASAKPAATEAPAAAPPKPKATKPAKATRRTKKRKAKAARATAPVAATTPDSAQEEAAVADESPAPAPTKATAPDFSRPIAAAPEPGDDAAALQVRAAMASYYADLNAPPLHASAHFAPQVERLYIRQNLTPAAIDAELARSFFPDNQHAVCQIEPGTLHVSDLASDGSRTATYVERMRLYRVSLQKYQRLRTQVRVRLNADNKIVYMRQEKLLSNSFEE